jgi:hypothetical protein
MRRVQAYIAALPGWKGEVGRRLDALITETVPGVSKVVRWNSPMYGVGQEGWFLGLHVFAKYINKRSSSRRSSHLPAASGAVRPSTRSAPASARPTR